MPRSVADDGREEAYKKGVFNQLLSHLAVTYAKEAACATGGASAELYSKAAAVYGNPFVDSASIGSTPQATANKRCKNYGTDHGGGVTNGMASTASERLQAWYDADGSASGLGEPGVPAILGSATSEAGQWWQLDCHSAGPGWG